MRIFPYLPGIVISILITITLSHTNVLKAQYCDAEGGCREYISSVQVGTINNSSSCDSYADYTALSTDMNIGTGYPVTITNGSPYSSDQCGIWVDWNQDQDFADADETITVTGTPGLGPYTAVITPPSGALTGNTRMRVRTTYTGTVDPCGTTTYGEVEDYTINVTTPMVFVSCTATQNEISDVVQGATNREIIGLQVVTSGAGSPLSASEFRIRTDGTTDYANDITNMKIWYTGTSPAFATGTQFGTTTAPQAPGTNTIISGSQVLSEGTNYFWVTYDINVIATPGNVVDAIFQNVDIGGLHTPDITDPFGSRTITMASNMTYTSGTVTQASTADVYPGHIDREIICVQVVTSGTLNPLSATSFQLQTTGSTSPAADLVNTKVYYTGTSPSFTIGNQFGTTYFSPPNTGTDYSINGNKTLSEGTNYFWVTYDISGSATAGDVVDGICNQITIGGSDYVPSVTNPAGNRPIVIPSTTECDNATPLSIGTVCYTKTFSTTGLTPSDRPNGACGADNVNDIWFKTVVPSSGELVIHTEIVSVAMDGAMALYYGPCTSLTEINCIDDVSGTPVEPMPTINMSDLIPGNILYIRFWEKNDVQADFSICCYDPSIGVGIDVDATQNDPTTLVETVLLDEEGCLEALNITHTGYSSSISYFDDGNVIGFNKGIILASGPTTMIEGQNNVSGAGSDVGTSGDTDLNALASPYTTHNASVLEFDFIPSSDTVSFRYVFGSEEYPEYVCSSFNDVFGFFLSGPGISGPYSNNSINIAQVPDDISGSINPPASYFSDPVAINAINPGVAGSHGTDATCNSQYPDWKDYVHYFVNNGTGSTPAQNQYTQLDGYTTPLMARVVLTACETYHIKLAVADASDGILDSGVFLEANSFKSPDPPQMSFATATSDMDQVYEGCTTTITVTRANTQDVLNPEIVYLDLTGSTATSGVDYPAIPNPVVIPPGDSMVVIDVTPYIDAVSPEADETIIINYQEGCPCTSSPIQQVINIKNFVGISGGIDNIDPVYCEGGTPTNLTTTMTGQGDYSYIWSTGETTDNINVSPLFNTTYSVTISDECGNITSDQVDVTVVSSPTTTFTHTATPCSYNNTISFIYTGNAGSSATYSWSFPGGTPATSTDQHPSNIVFPPGGTYTVELTSVVTENGCTSIAPTTAVIDIPSEVSGMITGTDVLCFGESTGSADLTPSGGTPPYTFTWNPGGFATTEDISGLSAGVYTVVINDSNGCVSPNPPIVIISQPAAALSANSPTITMPACNGDSNGEITANTTGGTAPYTYSWNTIPQQTTNPATGLSVSGGPDYTVTITDANSCTFIDTYTLTEPTAITLNTDHDNATCNQSNGSANVTATGGAGNFSYLWNTGATGPSITNVPSGTYTVTVTDTYGCSETATEIIDDEGAPGAMIDTIIHVTCNGLSDGALTVNASGGSPPYSYTWAPNVSTSSSATGLAAGIYFITITDQLGCNRVISDTIVQPDILATIITGIDVPCNDGNSYGSAELVVSGGTPPYSFIWSNNATTQDVDNLQSGLYYVTTTDNNSCSQVDSVTITIPPQIILDTLYTSNDHCGQGLGEAAISISGGTPPYVILWSDVQSQSNDTAFFLDGNAYYSVSITDANECIEVFDSIYIENDPGGEATITNIEHVACYGGASGSLTVGVNGGTPPYTYLWLPNYLTTPTISNLTEGTYFVVVTDSYGCQDSTNATIIQPDPIVAGIPGDNITNVACYGDETGSLEVTVTGGTPGYTYLWPSGGTNASDTGLGAGPYTVTVTDANGCTKTVSATITQPGTALLIDIIHADTICYGEVDGYAEISAYGGTEGSGYSYVWSGGQTGTTATDLPPGEYTVTATDANNCTAIITVPITEAPEITFTFDTVSTSCNGAIDGEIIIAANIVNPPYSYLWSNADTSMYITGLAPGYYMVTITDGNGCTTSSTLEVYNSTTPCMVIPNVITPNGDQYNDTWNIEYIRLYDEIVIQVFNRWGEVVFEFTGDGSDYEYDVSEQWDGTSSINKKPLPMGSYIYIIQFKNTEELEPMQGIITIVRKAE